jgi:hypothetical protein
MDCYVGGVRRVEALVGVGVFCCVSTGVATTKLSFVSSATGPGER